MFAGSFFKICVLLTIFSPFNFSDLQEDLSSIQSNIARSQFCSQRLLCRTLAGNNVYILTITSPASEVSFFFSK